METPLNSKLSDPSKSSSGPSNKITLPKKTVNSSFKKITPGELQHRREHNLCFKCGEKFGPEHICKDKAIHMLITEDARMGKTEEIGWEVIEYKGPNLL